MDSHVFEFSEHFQPAAWVISQPGRDIPRRHLRTTGSVVPGHTTVCPDML